MKTPLILCALTLSSALYVLPASAGCADPRATGPIIAFPHFSTAMAATSSDSVSYHTIVGTWRVSYASGGSPTGDAFIQWHGDGTEWENINFPVLGGNICMGSWKQVNAKTYSRNHYGWLFDGGIVSGYFNETETDVLSKDGNSYTGNNETKLYDLNGDLQLDLLGTASAERIKP